MKEEYLMTPTMVLLQDSMAAAASYLDIPLLEIWWSDEADPDHYQCLYIYASDQIAEEYPGLSTGHHVDHETKHVISQSVMSFTNPLSRLEVTTALFRHSLSLPPTYTPSCDLYS